MHAPTLQFIQVRKGALLFSVVSWCFDGVTVLCLTLGSMSSRRRRALGVFIIVARFPFVCRAGRSGSGELHANGGAPLLVLCPELLDAEVEVIPTFLASRAVCRWQTVEALLNVSALLIMRIT